MANYSAGSASVEISPDFSNFVRELRADLDRVRAELTVDVDADTTAAAQRIEELSRARTATVDIDVDGIQAADARLDEVARTRTARIDIDVDNSTLAATASGLQRVSGGADNAHRSLSLMSAVRFGGLAAGLTALIPILGGLAAAAGGIGAVFGGLLGAGAVGGNGIIDAFKASKEASAGAGQAAKDYQADLDRVADAQQRVIDAQHAEQEALGRVEDAQESLTDARKEAKDTIDDLNLAVKDGALSERGAELAYRRAVVNLQRVRQQAAAGKATSLDVDSAQLDVDRAAQNITSVRVQNQQTQRRADEANAGGIEGSDQVRAAQRNLEQAQYAYQQAGTETTRAIRELARAQQEAAKAADDAAGGTDKFAEAMAKLSPNAQEFIRAMQALGPQWTELRKAAQDNLFAGMGEAVTDLARNQLPALRDGLGQIATGLNGAIRQTLGSLDQLFTQLTQSGAMQAFIDGVNQALQGMAPFITGLTSAFFQLGTAIGPQLGPLFASLGAAIGQMAGPLGQLGSVFIQTLVQIMPTLTQFINALAEGLTPVLPVIGRLLDSVGQALIPLIPTLSQIIQIIGNALVEAVNALAPYLPTIAKAFADILIAVAPLVGPMAQLIGLITGAVAQNISTLAQALAPVVQQFAEGLRPVIPILAEHFQRLAPIFAQVAGILGQALARALETIMPVLPELIQAWSNMFIAIAPLLPELARLGAELLPILAEILVRVAPLIIDLLNNFTQLANFLVPILIPAIQSLADYTRTAWDVIRSVWDAMTSALGRLRDAFRDIINEIREHWADLVGAIQSPFTAPGTAVGRVFGSVLDKIGGNAEGGLIEGPGTGTSDSILARLSNGEYVVNAAQTARYLPVLQAINGDTLPKFAEGGQVQLKQTQTGQPAVVASMAKVVRDNFPGMTLTSGARNTADYHGQGKAADFSNGADDTPEMQRLASFIATNYPNSLELIHSPFSRNIKNGKVVGDGIATYGAATMQQHRNHVHWAVASPVSAPQARQATEPSTSQAPAGIPETATLTAPNDASNYSSTGTYVGPSSVDTTRDLQQAQQNQLPEQYSLPGILGRAGEILGQGILGFFGLENSILGSGNVYNRGISETVNFYAKKQDEQVAPAPTPETLYGTTGPDTQSPPSARPAPAAPAPPAKHTYNPGGGAEQWRGTVIGVLQGTGRSTGLADRTVAQIRIESGGNPNAQNNYDINAKNGVPSIGLLQVIKPTFDAYKDPRYPGTQRDPEPNIAAALNYVDKRYGGAAKIWPTTAGYADGGFVSGPGTGTSDSVPIWASNGEFVVNAAASAANGDWLRAINAGTARLAPAPTGFGARRASTVTNTRDHSVNFNGDMHVMDVDHLFRETDRWTSLQAQGALAAQP
ncbi:transglycosylase SLT domain-containing protein [Nocardia wallacei]|uniref:transglycosylase SLT domain-containing protein n=1 Tax=Nocardia wallacei TaxID=480035 RepID=UPI00245510EE|nr:transglycosylase SLT domain-containing protein [Nocardia wallacei]